MAKIRETLITNCERKFLNNCLTDWTRLDGRSFDEFRPLQIDFGKDWGSCYVSLGKTRVLAQTSCEVQQPKSSRPSEGILNVNIELTPMAASHFEPGRQSELSVQLNRLLEKCIKDSKAVDLESLCIKTNEKVWALRVDVNVINHEGNILDCASIALLASLAHFRRPDVTCDGEDFIIHNYEHRDPIQTVIHHYPICVTYSIFNGGEFILADPSLIEEAAADASLVIALNGFKELCGLHLGGTAELMPNVTLNVVGKAVNRAAKVIEDIKKSIQFDSKLRQNKVSLGFHLDNKTLPSMDAVVHEASIDLRQTTNKTNKRKNEIQTINKEFSNKTEIEIINPGSAEHIPEENEKKEWFDNGSEDDLIIIETPKEQIDLSDTDSEDVIILNNKTSA